MPSRARFDLRDADVQRLFAVSPWKLVARDIARRLAKDSVA